MSNPTIYFALSFIGGLTGAFLGNAAMRWWTLRKLTIEAQKSRDTLVALGKTLSGATAYVGQSSLSAVPNLKEGN